MGPRKKPFLHILFLLLFVALPLTVRAQGKGRTELQHRRVIRIDRTEIIPQSIELKPGEAFVWVNSAPATAQVVFDTYPGQNAVCAHGEGDFSQAHSRLLPFDSSPTCTLEPGTYTYTVYRQVAYRSGGADVRRLRAAIVVR